MKIFIWNDSSQGLGGGFSFIKNFIKGCLGNNHIQIVMGQPEADIIFIPSSSMVSKTDEVKVWKDLGKKIVLRVDNAVRDSRNRGAGMTKMKRLAEMADFVVYQCDWSMNYLQPYLGASLYGVVYNGVDTDVFHPEDEFVTEKYDGFHPKYLYSRYNRDETKRWEEAWYRFQMISRDFPNAKLFIVGQFSEELKQYNFDFYNGEKFEYLGVISNPYIMANLYRSCDVLLAPYYNDCYSNTIQEALACGMKVECNDTGGNPELLKNGVISLGDMVKNYYFVFKEVSGVV